MITKYLRSKMLLFLESKSGIQTEAQNQLLGSRYTVCMNQCLQQPLFTTGTVQKSCQTDTKCWMKKLENKVAKCVPSCVLKTNGLSPFIRAVLSNDVTQKRWFTTFTTKNPSTAVPPTSIGPFSHSIQCLADCLGKTVGEVLAIDQECQNDIECSVSRAGPRAAQCIDTCFKPNPPTLVTVQEELSRRGFVKCMARCLDLPISRVIGDFHHCGYVARCWQSEAGDRARACLDKCRGDRLTTDGAGLGLVHSSTTYQKMNRAVTKENSLASCAICLGMSIVEIMHLRETCGTNIWCWIAHIGEDLVHCLPKCLGLKIIADTDGFWKTVAPIERLDSRKSCVTCLGMTEVKHKAVSSLCGFNVRCWMPHLGEDLHCLPSCLLLQEREEENKMAAYKGCVRKIIGQSELFNRLWIKRCSDDVLCWQNVMNQVLDSCTK